MRGKNQSEREGINQQRGVMDVSLFLIDVKRRESYFVSRPNRGLIATNCY